MKTKRTTAALFGLLLSMLALHVQAKADYVPTIIVGVVKADSWTMNNNLEGIYQLDLADGGSLTMLNDEQDKMLAPLGGAVYKDGKMHGIHFLQSYDPYDGKNTYIVYNVEYNMKDWTRISAKALDSSYANLISSCGLTCDPITGANYGIFYNFDWDFNVLGRRLATIDFDNVDALGAPRKEIIDNIDTPFAAISFDLNGILYGVDMDGFLCAIDPDLAEVTILGDLGVQNITTYPSSMTCDPRTGKLYWSVVLTENGLNKSFLYEVTPRLGNPVATRLMQVPDNAYLVNMYIAAPEAEDNAPAIPESLNAVFAGDATTGTVLFNAPDKTYAGDPLTGTLNYTVAANGTIVATGTCQPGSEVSADVTVPAGDVTITAFVTNNVGNSPTAEITLYVGPATPKSPTDVALVYDEDTHTCRLTWKAPTEVTAGTAINARNLTYNVYRMEDNVKVASGIRRTSFTETYYPETLLACYYRVEAVNKGIVGEASESNKAVVGPALSVPYSETFANKACFDLLTVLDLNGDGKHWQYYKSYSGGGCAELYSNSSTDDDDWLITPPIQLEQGKAYQLSFEANTALGSTYDILSVAYGKGTEPTAYEMLFEDIILITPYCETPYVKSYIRPATSGAYRFGFHATTPAGKGWLKLDNVSITEDNSVPTTMQPHNLTATNPVIHAGQGTVTITGAQGQLVQILTADGRLIDQFTATDHCQRTLPTGLYLVRMAGTTQKVLLK